MNSYEVAKRIEKLSNEKGISGAELARRIGTDRSTINRYFKGTRKIGMDEVPKFAEVLGVDPVELLVGKKVHKEIHQSNISDYPFLPVSISAGVPIEIDALNEDDLETISIPDAVMGKWAGRSDIFIMRVNGESMNKIIPHNSLIAVKKIELDNLKNGDIVVYSDNVSYAVKHFYIDKANERLIFRPNSTDTSFTDYIVYYSEAENVKIHGKVVVYVVEMD